MDGHWRPGPHAVVFFDGVCNLCNGFVQFIIRHDDRRYFHFATLQSRPGRALLAETGYSGAPLSSGVLHEGGRV